MQITHSASLVFCLSFYLLFALSTLGIAIKGATSFSSPKKKHIVTKDVVGLLLGEIVSTKKTHIVRKDVVGLLVGDSKNDSLTKMKTY